MSLDRIFHIQDWCNIEEWLFQFAVFPHQAVLEVLVAGKCFFLWVSDIFLVVIYSKPAVFRFLCILFFAYCAC